MVKISSNDILGILRRFDIAGEENVPRHISNISITNPTVASTMASFHFKKHKFYVVYDDSVEDDAEYLVDQIRSDRQDIKGELLINPKDEKRTYAMPFKGKEVYLYAVDSSKVRLDQELASKNPDISRSTWQKYIKAGYVTVNGEVAESTKQEVLETDTITTNIPKATDYSTQDLPIVYLDDNVIVINKPIGVLSHSKGAMNDEFTVAEFFGRYSSYNVETNRPGIVHRLDRDTSGVMIGARNADTATMLQKQFADRKTKKHYVAVLAAIPKSPKAIIDLPIGRNPSEPSTFKVDSKGKSAQTKYEVLQEKDGQALVDLYPKTGRTHQLRVHMKYIGCPILGDKVYGKAADRLYLHARSLEITIPGGERKVFETDIPSDFTDKFQVVK